MGSNSLFGSNFQTQRVTTSGAEIHLVHGGNNDGKRPPLLLLHGYPQTHCMWHKVAPTLSKNFHVICADLRGYGDSAKPTSTSDHAPYSKRAMSQDMVDVMESFSYQEFFIAGHDRGARVAHRMMLDHPDRVLKVCVMDIVPTLHMYNTADRRFATSYYHWFFLIQEHGLPEHLIGADPEFYLRHKLGQWSGSKDVLEGVFDERAMGEYIRCFRNPDTIHASCEDYRAAAGIDLDHDEQDRVTPVTCPLLVLWGARGFVNQYYDVLAVWREWATNVEGMPLDCGHFLAEECPAEIATSLRDFFQ